jgi:DNA-binding response OmpR family regulator
MTDNPVILAIDDDHKFVTELKIYFGSRGINVATVSDPILSTSIMFDQFKIVLLDLDMPGRSGREVLNHMPAGHGSFVIIISGYSDLETRISLLESGADLFLSKPVDLNEIHLICRRILGRSILKNDTESLWTLSRSKHTLRSPTGSLYGLTSSEFLIIEKLLDASPDVVSKEVLTKVVTSREGIAAISFFRSLEVMISRMRSRFSETDFPLPIKALRNVGYIFHGNGSIQD